MASRWLYDNYIRGANTIVADLMGVNTRPASWLQDQSPQKTHRKLDGWVVITGYNDILDFEEGGTPLVATIASGNYLTGAEYAEAIEDALNAAASTNTYAVSYASQKFTIARATGSDTLSLLIVTGASGTRRSIGHDIGMLTDQTGDTSYTAANVSLQSRLIVGFDLGSSRDVTAAKIIEFTEAIASSPGGAQLRGDDADLATAFATPDDVIDLSGDAGCLAAYVTAKNNRYWILVLDATDDDSGYTEVGIVYLGGYFETSRDPDISLRKRREELSVMSFADGGSHFFDEKGTRNAYDVSYPYISEDEGETWEAVCSVVKVGRNLFFDLDPSTPEDTLYGYFSQPLSLENTPAVENEDFLKWTFRNSIVEAI